MKNIVLQKKLPTNDEIIAAFPISKKAEEQIEKDRAEVRNILSGKDKRLLMIVGPCSAWPYDAVLEYAARLKNLSDELSESLKFVLRVYIQKPRTTKGWTGPVNQPDPFAPADIAKGAFYARSLMVKTIEMGLPIADEAVFTHNAKGFIELLSWVAIGARSTEDQEHRIFASGVDAPVGMKNPTSGSIEIGVNSVIAAQHPHTAVFDGYQIETSGNAFAHLVLRGGADGTNYDEASLVSAGDLLRQSKLENPAIIVDASHENCRVAGFKDALAQMNVVNNVLDTLEAHSDLRDTVKGFMLESFIKSGAQNLNDLAADTVDMGGLSVTDPCMGWEETEKGLRDLANRHQKFLNK